MVKVVFQVSEIGPGFEPVYMRGPEISEAPLGAVAAADMDCLSVDLTQRSSEPEMKSLGKGTSQAIICYYQLLVREKLECPSYAMEGS